MTEAYKPGELPEPPILPQVIWVHAGTPESRKLICTRCEIQEVHWPENEWVRPEACLHLYGISKKNWDDGVRGTSTAIVLPCKYVTYIDIGPQCDDTTPGEISDWITISPWYPVPDDAMSLEVIQATIQELGGA